MADHPAAASKPRNGIYPTLDMRQPKASRLTEASPKPAIFQIRRPDTTLFTSLDGLTKQTGEPAHRLRRLVLKELADNALDACDAASRPGQATIECRGPDTYIVTDQGDGIAGSPDELAALFTVHRPMVSTKYLRRPERGALGTGLRIVVGCIVAAGGTVEITTRGSHVVLHPRRVGPTEVVSVSSVPRTTGTTLTVRLSPEIPTDDNDLLWAKAAIDFAISAEMAAAPPAYTRQPSPHWLDADAFTEVLMLIEPNTVTVRQAVEMFDGCTGAKAGRLAEPFGKGRLARSMSDADAAALLASMQDTAREVKHTALCPIGADAFDPDDYDYARAAGVFTYGPRGPRATIPFVVEAWACATSRKGKSAEIDGTFVNRTPIVGDRITARRGFYEDDAKRLCFDGCGLTGLYLDDWPPGSFTAVLHVISPYVPLLSIGKRPNMLPFLAEIDTAMRRALVRSRKRLPPDKPEPKERPPLKPPRPEKVEPPPKPPPAIFLPRTELGRRINGAAEASGIAHRDLLVLSKGNDPYDLDNAAGHAIGRWFGDQVARYVPDGQAVHLRGLFYRIVAAASARRPDTGKLFTNTDANWRWLQQKASKAARWLGYVPFRRIRDHRSDPPEVHAADGSMIASEGARSLVVDDGQIMELPALGTLIPQLTATEPMPPQQPFRLAFIGEKSSLGPVLQPLAREFQAELLLSSGDPSETHIAEMAERAAADPRPFIVFYFSDFDPGGWTMPIAVARKFQAHRHLRYPELDVRLYRIALTLDQVIAHDLPSTPLKDTELRKAKWLEMTGREQTEIDALAALRPDVLEQIARDGVAPFFDPTLADRFADATRLPSDIGDWFTGLPAYDAARSAISATYGPLVRAIDELNDTVSDQVTAMRDAVRDADGAPKLDPVEIKPEITAEAPEPLFTTADDFATSTRKLIASKRDFDDGGEDAP